MKGGVEAVSLIFDNPISWLGEMDLDICLLAFSRLDSNCALWPPLGNCSGFWVR
jgi:hypothetical protein